MVFRFVFILVFYGLLHSHAYSEEDKLKKIYDYIIIEPGTTANFTQLKHISALKRPLKSDGLISLSGNDTVIWEQLAPYPVKLQFFQDGIEECTDICRSTIDGNPLINAMAQAFIGLLTGKSDKLKTFFEISVVSENTKKWEIALTPVDDAIKKAIHTIRVSGDRHLKELQIFEAGENTTSMWFSGHSNEKSKSVDH